MIYTTYKSGNLGDDLLLLVVGGGGGLEHVDYFSIYWECHHPNWF